MPSMASMSMSMFEFRAKCRPVTRKDLERLFHFAGCFIRSFYSEMVKRGHAISSC